MMQVPIDRVRLIPTITQNFRGIHLFVIFQKFDCEFHVSDFFLEQTRVRELRWIVRIPTVVTVTQDLGGDLNYFAALLHQQN